MRHVKNLIILAIYILVGHGISWGMCGNEDLPDADCDGFFDSMEINEYSDPEDAGEIPFNTDLNLMMPWNGFLDMVNVLELVNPRDVVQYYAVNMLDKNGDFSWGDFVPVPPGGQVDIIVNELPGFERDAYGMIFVGEGFPTNTGQMVYYKPGTGEKEYDFVLPIPFQTMQRGVSNVSFNTFDPISSIIDPPHQYDTAHNNDTYNWLSLMNPRHDRTYPFIIKSFDINGNLILERFVIVPPLGRIDIDGGHGILGQDQVGTHEITPMKHEDHSQVAIGRPYVAFNSRYIVREATGELVSAGAFYAKQGTGHPQYVMKDGPLSPEANYLEVINTTDEIVEYVIEVGSWCDPMRPEGAPRYARKFYTLPPRAQAHFSATSLGDRKDQTYNGYDVGNEELRNCRPNPDFVMVQGDRPGSIISQLVTYSYFRDEMPGYDPDFVYRRFKSATYQTSRTARGKKFVMSYNTFLDHYNKVNLVNTSKDFAVGYTVDITHYTGESVSDEGTTPTYRPGQLRYISPDAPHETILNEPINLGDFGFDIGYGQIVIEADTPNTIIPFNFRTRYTKVCGLQEQSIGGTCVLDPDDLSQYDYRIMSNYNILEY